MVHVTGMHINILRNEKLYAVHDNVHPMDVFYPAIEYSLRIEYRVMTRLSDISAGQYYVNMLAALHKLKTYSVIWRKGWIFLFFYLCISIEDTLF